MELTDIPNDTDPQAIELQSFLEKNGVVKTLAHFSGLDENGKEAESIESIYHQL
ncbi:hypothetical protein [Enterovibrio norvegicus]|uniref:hypothetical protein n=1 Tax=Enterovibrio norvegicus TaxID=188144 RepID=UPI0014301D54|nr:hypothetical protein [Enterovibrio norvegicus]